MTNSAFTFSKRHPYLQTAMEDLASYYKPECWSCIGPDLLTASAWKLTNTTIIKNIPASANMNVTLIQRMMPVYWTNAEKVFWQEKPVKFEVWRKLFENSSSIHFYSKMTSYLMVDDDPQYCAYALLGPQYCPSAYFSSNQF